MRRHDGRGTLPTVARRRRRRGPGGPLDRSGHLRGSVSLRGLPEDVSWHAAKSIDKGYLATDRPSDGSPVLARAHRADFVLEATRTGSRCTVASVAALTLHENPDPYLVAQPGGVIDTHDAMYEQLDGGRVKVTGSRYVRSGTPTLKIEGVELVGYRAVLLAGIRDPRILDRIDEFLDAYRALLERGARSMSIEDGDYRLGFRVYGRDAVLGPAEPESRVTGHEVALLVEVVGATPEICDAIGSRLGPTGNRLDINGNLGGGGVFAYPFSPSLLKTGPVYEWSAWHLVDTSTEEMESMFPVTIEEVGGEMRLCDLATSIKSGNAGASQITMDIAFADRETFEAVVASGCPDPSAVSRLYGVEVGQVQIHCYRPANTIKVTIPRAVISGGMEERDFDGVQQYVPLLSLEVGLH